MLLFDRTTATSSQVMSVVEESVQEMSAIDLMLMGGVLMVPILILAILTIYIFLERYMFISANGKVNAHFISQIKHYMETQQVDHAMQLCKQENTPVARMIEKGISRLGKPLSDVQTAIENIGNLEVGRMERNVSVLATASGGAPMIGFLGTVIGMIQAFYDLSANATGGNINITDLSSGIYQAMVTTVAGLIVGILAYFAYNILVSKIDKLVIGMEASTTVFMDSLNNHDEYHA